MRNTVLFLCLLFSIVVVFSCSPDPVDLPSADEEATFIKTIVDIDYRTESFGDTLFEGAFIYDWQKRLIRYVGNNSVDQNWTREYFYNEPDSLPMRINLLRNTETVKPNLFTYSNGIINKDSVVDYENGQHFRSSVTTYTKTGENSYFVYSITTYYNPFSQFTSDSLFVNVGFRDGNLVVVTDSSYYSTNGGATIDGTRVNNIQFEYDNKPSPYKGYAVHYPMYLLIRQESLNYVSRKNNLIKEVLIS